MLLIMTSLNSQQVSISLEMPIEVIEQLATIITL